MSIDVADLRAKLGADTTGFHTGMGEAQSAMAGFASKAHATFSGIATVSTAMGAAVTGGLLSSVHAAAGFEETMSGVKAVSGATADQMHQLSGLALQLGKDTSFSAAEAGQGIEELVKGGVSITDIMGGAAKATLNLAAAGGVDLAQASEIAANAASMFGISGRDMAHVADLIAGAANASSLDVTDFKFSLAAVGAVAKLTGVSFDDMSVAIAEMGAAGIKGSDAGTSLKSMFMNLVPGTTKAFDEMQKLGLITLDTSKTMEVLRAHGIEPLGNSQAILDGQLQSLAADMKKHKEATGSVTEIYKQLIDQSQLANNHFFDSTGKMKGLADVSDVLKTALAGMSKEQELATLKILFGTDGIRAASLMSENGAAGFDKMAAAMGHVTAASVAAERLNNLNGWMEQLKGSVETLQIGIGTLFLPTLTDMIKSVTGVVNSMIEWTGAHPALTKMIVELALAVGALGAASGGAKALLGPLLELVMPLASALSAVALPLVAIGAAVAVLAVAWQKDWGGIQEVTAQALQVIQPAIEGIKSAIGGLMSGFNTGGVSGLFNAIPQAISTMMAGLNAAAANLQPLIAAFAAWVPQAVNGMVAAFPAEFQRVMAWIQGQVAPITKALGGWADAFVAWVAPMFIKWVDASNKMRDQLFAWIVAQAGPMLAKLAAWKDAFVAWVVPATTAFLAVWPKQLDRFLSWIGQQAAPILGKLAAWASSFIQWVAPLIPGLLTALAGIAAAITVFIAETLVVLGKKLLEWGKQFVEWVAPLIPPLLSQLGTLLDRLVAWLHNTGVPLLQQQLIKWKDEFVAWLPPAWDALKKNALDLASKLVAWVKADALPLIQKQLILWKDAFVAWLPPAWNALKTNALALLSSLGAWIKDDAAPAIGKQLGLWATAFVNWVPGAATALLAEIKALPAQLKPAFDVMIAAFKNLGSNLVSGLIDGVKGMAKPLGDAMGWLGDHTVGLFKGIVGSHSPSTVFMEIGKDMMDGLAIGIRNNAGSVTDEVKKVAQASKDVDFNLNLPLSDPTGKGGGTSNAGAVNQATGQAAKAIGAPLTDALANWAPGAFDKLMSVLPTQLARVVTWAQQTAAPAITSTLALSWTMAFTQWLDPAGNELIAKATGMVNRFTAWLRDSGEADIVKEMGFWQRALTDWPDRVWGGGLHSSLTTLIGEIRDWGRDPGLVQIKTAMQSWQEAMWKWSGGIWPFLDKELTKLSDEMDAKLVEILQKAQAAMKGAGSLLSGSGGLLVSGLIAGVVGKGGDAVNTVLALQRDLQSKAQTAAEGGMVGVGAAIVASIAKGVIGHGADLVNTMAQFEGDLFKKTIADAGNGGIGTGAAIVNGIIGGLAQQQTGLFAALASLQTSAASTAAAGALQAGENVGQNIIQGMISGVGAMGQLFGSFISGWTDHNVTDQMKKALGIQSPSTVFAEIGRHVVAGLVGGIEGGRADARKSAGNLAGDLSGAAIHPSTVATAAAQNGGGRSGPVIELSVDSQRLARITGAALVTRQRLKVPLV